eukprot:2732719-Pleurochrysis_carterae.AAC.2
MPRTPASSVPELPPLVPVLNEPPLLEQLPRDDRPIPMPSATPDDDVNFQASADVDDNDRFAVSEALSTKLLAEANQFGIKLQQKNGKFVGIAFKCG